MTNCHQCSINYTHKEMMTFTFHIDWGNIINIIKKLLYSQQKKGLIIWGKWPKIKKKIKK